MQYSLFVYPQHEHRPFHYAELEQFLIQQHFVERADTAKGLSPGPRLMEFITFLGCSPALSSGDFESDIRLWLFDSVTGMGGHSIEALRFPRCKHVIKNPDPLLDQPSTGQWQCHDCANHGQLAEINWRKSAAFADCFIEVAGIFPKEAIPSASFINLLTTFSESDWGWFYSQTTPLE